MEYTSVPPVLERIAQCESEGRQFKDDGSVLVSRTRDIGLFQINRIHKKEALEMGYDLDTIDGNTLFALYLYKNQGTSPWNSSKRCWAGK